MIECTFIMPHIEVPKTSREVAGQVYQEYIVNPSKFIRETASLLEQKDPHYLDAVLESAVDIALISYYLNHPHDYSGRALERLGGNFFRYTCSAREVQTRGQELPELGNLVEPASLQSSAFMSDKKLRSAAGRIAVSIERDDPEVGNIVRQYAELPMSRFRLESADEFIRGVNECHRRLQSTDLQSVQPAPVDINPEPSPLPVVRRSIVRTGLLEMILDPHHIATMSERESLSLPALLNQRSRSWQDDERALISYQLTSDFAIYCLEQEFKERQKQFPVIQELGEMYPDPTVETLLHSFDEGELDVTLEERDRMLKRYRDAILEEIKMTNPHLSWGINRLLMAEMGPKYLFAAVEGIVSTYTAIREQLSPDTPSKGQMLIMEEMNRPKETIEYHGSLHLYAATGTEGSFLAFYDEEPDTNRPERYGWDRFHHIKHGDKLVIYSPENLEKVIWQGEVVLKDSSQARYDKYGDGWKYISQQGVNLEEWSGWFSNEYPAKLTTQRTKKPQ